MLLLVVARLRYAFIAAMLVLTLRPTGFLLGIGSRGWPAASVLRVACEGNYGAGAALLEANGTKVLRSSLRRVVPRHRGRTPAIRCAGGAAVEPDCARSPDRRTSAAGCGRGR